MSIALDTAASGMQATQDALAVIANNLANMRTAGFKQQQAHFATQMSIDKARVGSISDAAGNIIPVGAQIGLGVKTIGVSTVLSQGAPVQTGNTYHIAIQGNGYFQVELPSGDIAYTRAGIFDVNADGTIVTQEGFTVSPGITIPQNTVWVKITNDGNVMVKLDGNLTPQNVGQIELASFANPAGLQSIEGNMLLETPASGAPIIGVPGSVGFGKILQHWYEGSNVESVTGITSLIDTQRAFELNAKVAKAADEMDRNIASMHA